MRAQAPAAEELLAAPARGRGGRAGGGRGPRPPPPAGTTVSPGPGPREDERRRCGRRRGRPGSRARARPPRRGGRGPGPAASARARPRPWRSRSTGVGRGASTRGVKSRARHEERVLPGKGRGECRPPNMVVSGAPQARAARRDLGRAQAVTTGAHPRAEAARSQRPGPGGPDQRGAAGSRARAAPPGPKATCAVGHEDEGRLGLLDRPLQPDPRRRRQAAPLAQ